jgi:predicted lipoprotein with Yx(FWY)xxD motif
MLKRTVVIAVLALALAAAGVATAAAVTQQGSHALAASNATAGRVTLHKTSLGKVLATSSGRTLYLFLRDKHGRSACYGACPGYWPPLMKKGALRAGAGVSSKLLGTTKRRNGKRQVMYNRHPVYLYKLDSGSGRVSGQGQNFFGGKWYVVSAAGKAIKAAPPAGTTTSSTSTGGTTTCGYPPCP